MQRLALRRNISGGLHNRGMRLAEFLATAKAPPDVTIVRRMPARRGIFGLSIAPNATECHGAWKLMQASRAEPAVADDAPIHCGLALTARGWPKWYHILRSRPDELLVDMQATLAEHEVEGGVLVQDCQIDAKGKYSDEWPMHPWMRAEGGWQLDAPNPYDRIYGTGVYDGLGALAMAFGIDLGSDITDLTTSPAQW